MKTGRLFKLISVILVLIMLVSNTSIFAAANQEISVYINNEKISFDVAPMIVNGRTLVPLRAIFEGLGASVEWDGDTNTAYARKGDVQVAVTVGAPFMVKNMETAIPLEVPAKIENGRILVPLRAVSESFGCNVGWNGETRAINIFVDRKVLRMATNAEFPPYEYIEGGEIKGIDIEIAYAIAQDLGYELEIFNMPFDAIIPSIRNGKADFGIAGMTVTQERLQEVNFSNPYLKNEQLIIINKGSKLDFNDLDKRIIGVVAGTTGCLYASDDYGKGNVVEFKDSMGAVLALKSGAIDVFVIDGPKARNIVAQNTDLEIFWVEYSEEYYAIPIAKNNPELRDRINSSIKKLTDNGTFEAIIKKYSPN